MAVPFLDLAAQHTAIRAELDRAWQRVVTSSQFVGGPCVDRFEAEWAAYCGADHAIGVANGTDAIELVLRGLDIGAGDEVVVPANTFVATVEAIVAVGARPRFVDVEPDTLLITADIVAEAIGPATAAVVVVHLYGNMPDMAAIAAVCRARGVALVEDAAQAHGARHAGRRAGAWGVAAAFSFYPGKNLGAFGDAGAITTDDAALAARIRAFANHGRSLGDRHRHDHVGRNSRLDNLQAAVLSVKLPHLDGWNANRRRAAGWYGARLPAMARPVVAATDTDPVWHLFVVQVHGRDQVAKVLDHRGVGIGVHYPVPCHVQPAYAVHADHPLPVCEAAAPRLLSLPMHPSLREADVDAVCQALSGAANG